MLSSDIELLLNGTNIIFNTSNQSLLRQTAALVNSFGGYFYKKRASQGSIVIKMLQVGCASALTAVMNLYAAQTCFVCNSIAVESSAVLIRWVLLWRPDTAVESRVQLLQFIFSHQLLTINHRLVPCSL